MDASLCRDHLERILTDEAAALERLESLLDREHKIIVDQDLDALERSGAERQTCVGDLLRIEDERRSLCRQLGKKADASGLNEVVLWCDPRSTLQLYLDECAVRAIRCRAANDRNGMLVASRLKRVEGLLNAITGREQAHTYGNKQFAQSPAASGRVIRSQA